MAHFRIIEHTVCCQPFREWPGATEPGQSANLKLAVKQYIPKTNPKPDVRDVTFIGAHANGFPKVCTVNKHLMQVTHLPVHAVL